MDFSGEIVYVEKTLAQVNVTIKFISETEQIVKTFTFQRSEDLETENFNVFLAQQIQNLNDLYNNADSLIERVGDFFE